MCRITCKSAINIYDRLEFLRDGHRKASRKSTNKNVWTSANNNSMLADELKPNIGMNAEDFCPVALCSRMPMHVRTLCPQCHNCILPTVMVLPHRTFTCLVPWKQLYEDEDSPLMT
ncbi:hypothetical protein PR048_019476 [Dryococelus australis]|uniref:Uncharacterized protein n=1 Tax=Dryococelus australis TaxID=614101 RepID=A0ABQ9H3P1_9NEOP|nr:hypothetical protein PR048_019476 [Dryococelus australis]